MYTNVFYCVPICVEIFTFCISTISKARRAGSDGSMSASVSAGPGFNPRRGSKFSFEIFQPRGQEGWRCTLSNRQIVGLDHRPGLNSKRMLRRHIVLLRAIRPPDGDVKPGGPLGAFREEQAMSPAPGFTFSLPFIVIITHNIITLHKQFHIVILTSTFYSTLYRYSSHT